MTHKQIEASREVRLWIGQVIVPAVGVSVALLANPQIKSAASEKLESLKQRFRHKKEGTA